MERLKKGSRTNSFITRRYNLSKISSDKNDDFTFPAYAGGRTEGSTLYCQLSEEDQKAGWSMEYLDVTSLYPYVLTDPAFLYPNGHPRYIKENFPRNNEELLNIHGLVKAEILPPRDLFWPILWMRGRDSGTLLFPLCRTCAEGKQ